ncbi:hypothetical protein MHTCC0001_09460 [Flavobacteriaceae bacterium MHTCC 0001]
MNTEKLTKIVVRISLYFILAVGLTYILIKSVETLNYKIFWTFMIVMGISAIITRWFSYSDKKNNLIRVIEHITYICALTLFLFWFSTKYLLDH